MLHERHKVGKAIHHGALIRDGYAAMCGAISREFGSFEAAIRAAGLDYDKIRGDRTFKDWSGKPDRVLEGIRNLAEMGYELNYSSVHEHDKTLCWAARKYFGSWYGAVSKAGFDTEAVRRDRGREADKGNIFENICFEIFGLLRAVWQKEVAIDCGSGTAYPDLYDPTTKEWIDMKLRAFGESTALSMKKYAPFAMSLRFIYLLGSRESKDGVIFQSIFDFEEEARGTDVEHLFDNLRELKSYKPPPLHLEEWAIRWTKQIIIDWIIKKPLDALSERNVLLEHNDLRCAARRLFGSWNAALNASGISPDSVRKQRPRIEKHELDVFIQGRWEKDKKLNPRHICDHFGGEYNAAIRIYGGWRQAVTSNDIPYNEVLNKKSAQQKNALDSK
ncbi:MAG: hypothetical protein V3U15_02525 [Nitrospinota bacterium]